MIHEGDLCLNASGATQYITSVQEAAQRVRIAASTAKGAFRYNRALGTDYAALSGGDISAQKLEMLIKEACCPIAGAEIEVVSVDAEEEKAVLRISCAGTAITTEVDLHGNL